MNQTIEESVMPESIKVVKKLMAEDIHNFKIKHNVDTYRLCEIQQPCKDGNVIWVEISMKSRVNSKGELEMLGVSRNIEERKKTEEKILYLSYFDQLTGLNNRRFYEEELIRLDSIKYICFVFIRGCAILSTPIFTPKKALVINFF